MIRCHGGPHAEYRLEKHAAARTLGVASTAWHKSSAAHVRLACYTQYALTLNANCTMRTEAVETA